MSSYIALARKWRPSQFKDIVGQESIVRTLTNAISASRIHQAYLFTGSRGIGKTSIARIFSKVIRCEKTQSIDGHLQSCDQCSNCKEITNSSSVDVIEIDGASNNGVDAIREIRENVKFFPASGSKKIYIIDEVHMLTTAAFNALLKTLEEPPSHVLFILATTEPHKIPATILSRCQRFDFKRVTIHQMQQKIEHVLVAEKIKSEQGVSLQIARASEGSMRDALSLLDQVIAYSGNFLSLEDTRQSLGLIESTLVLSLIKSILEKNIDQALLHARTIYEKGHDFKNTGHALIEFLYYIILSKTGSKTTLQSDLTENELNQINEMTSLRSLEELELIFQVFHHGIDAITHSGQPKILFDLLIIKTTTAEILSPIQTIQSHSAVQRTISSDIKPVATQNETLRKEITKPAIQTNTPSSINWEDFVSSIRQTRPLLATTIEYANKIDIPNLEQNNSKLIIHFGKDESYRKDQLQSKNYSDELSILAEKFFKKRIQIEIKTNGSDSQDSLAAKKIKSMEEKTEKTKASIHQNPIIQEAKSLFGAEIGPIELSQTHASNSGDSNE